ncbi:MAG: SDR family NAD(P)-dependent oxidoreductase, partial [Candidatus Heimdallarchaeota archaeon]
MVKDKLIKRQPFKGKKAILVGASTGMGRAIAKDFVNLGGSVLIIARRENILQEAAIEIHKQISNESQFVESISCDATEIEKLKPLLVPFVKKHGTPDYLFNLVGHAIPGYIEEYTLDDFTTNMNANYYGQLVPTLIILPEFMREKKGHIIFFSSMLGYMGM